MTSMCLFGTLYGLVLAVFVVSFRVCLSVRTSKACYGVQGPILPCTKHTLECSSGMIVIQDAYYTNSTACHSTGLSSCNINVSSVPDTGRYQDFNETQLNNLYKACLNERRCTFDGGRISGNVAFSIVKFNCINNVYNACGHVNATTSNASILWKRNNSQHKDNTCTCTISTLQSNTNLSLTALDMKLKNTRQLCPGVTISVDGNSLPVNCSQLSPYQLQVNMSQQVQVTVNKGEIDVTVLWIRIRGNNTVKVICAKKLPTTTDFVESTPTTVTAGAVAGGVVVALVIIAAVVAFVLWFKFKRNKEPGVKSEKPSDSYSVVTPRPTNMYSTEVTTKTSSNYDYATVHDGMKSTGHVRIDDYDLATTPVDKRKVQNGESSRMDEDDYNHLDGQNKIVSNGDKHLGYDTSASAIAAVRKLQNVNSSNREGDYDYNHLSDNSDVKPAGDDYDTAATASRAVAQMVKDKDTAEDDYDHFHKTEIKSLDSPYDTTKQCVNETDHSLAGTVDKNDPYDHAK